MNDLPEEFKELMCQKSKLQLEITKLINEFEDRYGRAIEVESIRIERMRAFGPHNPIVIIAEMIVRS
jgi:hypothetical protein